MEEFINDSAPYRVQWDAPYLITTRYGHKGVPYPAIAMSRDEIPSLAGVINTNPENFTPLLGKRTHIVKSLKMAFHPGILKTPEGNILAWAVEDL